MSQRADLIVEIVQELVVKVQALMEAHATMGVAVAEMLIELDKGISPAFYEKAEIVAKIISNDPSLLFDMSVLTEKVNKARILTEEVETND